MDTNDKSTHMFETNGCGLEMDFIDLINQVAGTIANSTGLSNAELRRVRAYGIQRFKDIDKMEY